MCTISLRGANMVYYSSNRKRANRPYSKVIKSIRAKVAVIFAHFRFSVFILSVLMQPTNSEFSFETNQNFDSCKIAQKLITLNLKWAKITVTFSLVDLLTFE
jgi:hypothetical protein